MIAFRCLAVVLLPLLPSLLAGCSDQRASYEINGRNHALSLVRVTTFPWAKTASYSLVATRMPDCLRRHHLPDAALDARVEVFSPGNNAWIVRQEGRLFVTETRTCEGFATLSVVPDGGLGVAVGSFEMRDQQLVFVAAPEVELSPASSVAPVDDRPPPAGKE